MTEIHYIKSAQFLYERVSKSREQIPVLSQKPTERCLQPLDLRWREREGSMQILLKYKWRKMHSSKVTSNNEKSWIAMYCSKGFP